MVRTRLGFTRQLSCTYHSPSCARKLRGTKEPSGRSAPVLFWLYSPCTKGTIPVNAATGRSYDWLNPCETQRRLQLANCDAHRSRLVPVFAVPASSRQETLVCPKLT